MFNNQNDKSMNTVCAAVVSNGASVSYFVTARSRFIVYLRMKK